MVSHKKRLADARRRVAQEVVTDERKKEILDYISLVDTVRRSRNKVVADKAFEEIVKRLEVKIQQFAHSYRIPGCEPEDIYAEAMLALKYKAIQDYDQTRSDLRDISPFDKFAMLCIRRHLSTKRKSSYQNKHKALNTASSLNEDRSSGSNSDDSLCLSDIVPQNNKDILKTIYTKEHYRMLLTRLVSKLSDFEKEVFIWYCKKLSYEQITEKINSGKRNKVPVKSIDNAISRIKQKGHTLNDRYQD